MRGSSTLPHRPWRSIASRDERWVLLSAHEGTETVRAEPFEELEIALRDLWIEPIEPAP